MKRVYYILNQCLLTVLALMVLGMGLNSFSRFISARVLASEHTVYEKTARLSSTHQIVAKRQKQARPDSKIPRNNPAHHTHCHQPATVLYAERYADATMKGLVELSRKHNPSPYSFSLSKYDKEINPPPPKA
ncbi:hypothetical protein SAMN04488132_11616 [Sediminibacterium ginsengisoli]|uniref:Uncharacterized protein n=2 Tax=Sediminibacterium ginsengisoli TaxID=413434 RepID=A0A1T4RY49_9BACT|nr:hypothetical protein SAMN04488132_11616 [Sediminibacterium ginsengisoli]